MMGSGMDDPVLAVTIGDPCGIGAEVIVKALASGEVPGRTVLVGDAGVVRRALDISHSRLQIHAVRLFEEAQFRNGYVDVIDPGTLNAEDITVGQVSPKCGQAVLAWEKVATELARQKKISAIVTGPVNVEAIGARTIATGNIYLLLITGPLRVVHLTDHITLRQMLDEVRMDNLVSLIRLTHRSLEGWGVAKPRIGVAGLNPHCKGPEEEQEIAPAVRKAVSEGINASGPIPPDTIFRYCIEGRFDCVVALYHDQGHIPVKTWRFDGNSSIHLGMPYISMSVAHGSAFDIAGKGIADPKSMATTMKTAAMLGAGKGFPTG